MARFVVVAVCVWLAAASARAGEAESGTKLNVLFIAADDLRCDLGCYGHRHVKTPHLDRLAKRGVVFRRAYCQQAVCNPSRASLMTGRRPDTLKVWDLRTHFREALPEVVTLPEHLKRHGYHARAIGKIYHGREAMQDRRSWSVPERYAAVSKRDQYALPENLGGRPQEKQAATEAADVADEAYVDGKVAAEAVAALGELKERPFFLAVGFRKPHLPFCAPKRYWDLYDRQALSAPANPRAPEGAPEIALHESVELRGYKDIPGKGPLSREKIAELRHGYLASISYIDALVGKVLAELERLELAERTVVVFWSDHGYHLGEHDLWCKTTNYELDTRVPLIVAAPGMRSAGAKCDALVELVDLYPTLAELCGLPPAEGLEGTSFAPLLDNAGRPWKRAALNQFPRPWFYRGQPEAMGYSIRTERWRLVLWRELAEPGRVAARELYDHADDPRETRNLAGEPKFKAVVKTLTEQLEAGWRAAVPDAAR